MCVLGCPVMRTGAHRGNALVGLWVAIFVLMMTNGAAAQAAGEPAVPPPPSNYAVPPPPPAPPRYPAAPDLSAPVTPDAAAASTDVASEAPQLRIPSHVATRLRVLSTDINTLATRGGGGIADGVFSIITGGTLIALGALFSANGQTYLAPSLYVFGGASISRGLIDLILVPNPYNLMLEYGHMPMGSVEQVKARLRFGEHGLEELASRNRLARLLDGAINIGAGATLIGLTVSARSGNDAGVTDSNGTVLLVLGVIGAATLIVGGTISLLTSTDSERRWEAYQGLRDRLAQERALERARRSSITWRVSPVVGPQVAIAMLTVKY